MNKKIVIIGLLLVLASIGVLFIGGNLVLNNASLVSNQLKSANLTISAGNFSYVQLGATNASFFVLLAKLSNNANFYVFNQSGFSAWSAGVHSARGASGIRYAISLENKGAFMIYKNTSTPSVPPLVSSDPSLIFAYNSSIPYPQGSYYFVVDNTNGSASSQMLMNAQFVYAPPINNQSIKSGALGSIPAALVNNELLVGGVFFILLVAGICVTLYGLVKKPPETPVDMLKKNTNAIPVSSKVDPKYVDALYRGVGKKRRAKQGNAKKEKG
jgi:hypothetical protein